MAPPKAIQKGTTLMPSSLARKGISTRSKNITNDQNADIIGKKCIGGTIIGKRKADASPPKNDHRVKRSALGNLTNAVSYGNNNMDNIDALKNNVTGINGAIVKKPKLTLTKSKKTNEDNEQTIKEVKSNSLPICGDAGSTIVKSTNINAVQSAFSKMPSLSEFQIPKPISIGQMPTARPTKVMTRATLRAITSNVSKKHTTTTTTAFESTAIKTKDVIEVAAKPMTRRISNDFEKTDDSLYMSALEETSESLRLSLNSRRSSVISITSDSDKSSPSLSINISKENLSIIAEKVPPADVVNFDKENWDDPFQVSHYAMDIFEYLKEREQQFAIDDYMDRQVHLTKWMRMLLVDWMVEVQETFELNHETLYLAVKIVDIYLGKVIVIRDKLQLLGAAALFLACKYDERTPPLIEDFLYICDKAYTQKELIRMEMDVFKLIGFDLGIPLSYRFLRRYARCAKVAMPILTLARYVLEMALMEYSTIILSDSKVACAALFIALRMNNLPGWNSTLEYYSGYKLNDFSNIVPCLNAGLHQKPREQIKTVRNKYSHEIFFEVAKIKLMTVEKLFDITANGNNNESCSLLLNILCSSNGNGRRRGGGSSGHNEDDSRKH